MEESRHSQEIPIVADENQQPPKPYYDVVDKRNTCCHKFWEYFKSCICFPSRVMVSIIMSCLGGGC